MARRSSVTHYLDDIIHFFPDSERHVTQLKADKYIKITNLLEVHRNDEKDRLGEAEVFGCKLDTFLFKIWIP
jgi:hypothetical protein